MAKVGLTRQATFGHTERMAGSTGCIDGLITIPSEDGPIQTACHCTDCKRVHAAARAERAARAAVTTAFDRLPVVEDEEF